MVAEVVGSNPISHPISHTFPHHHLNTLLCHAVRCIFFAILSVWGFRILLLYGVSVSLFQYGDNCMLLRIGFPYWFKYKVSVTLSFLLE